MKNENIYYSLIGQFNTLQTREILLAREGLKVSRTLVPPQSLEIAIDIIERIGLFTAIYDKKYFYWEDCGKGGWVSRYGIELPLEADHGSCMIYIADRPELALEAMRHEHRQNDRGFGDALGIPPCCINTYVTSIEHAELKQNDYLEFSHKNTHSFFPYNYWTNVVAQYFGYCLLSHYPCSFDCLSSSKMAQITYSVLCKYSIEFANHFLEYHRSNYLYTEYDGVFRFPDSKFKDGILHYDPKKIESTLNSIFSDTLRKGGQLSVLGKHSIRIEQSAGPLIAVFDHPDLSILIFN